ncbi:MAG: MerR family transcriptional regulator [Solirubrobacteraceae bacterium]
MEQLLTIGEFAERCGLSRSALRFYDQNDLLRPQLVDAESGYRYYGTEQIARAALVRRLRAAEMPVGLVRRYLAASLEERRAVLEVHLSSFRERATEVENAVEGLRRDLDGEDRAGGARCCWVAAAAFAEALAQVSFAIADPAVHAELGVVWIETREGSLRLVATDSYRLAVRDLVPDRVAPDGLRGVIDAEHTTALASALASAEMLVLSQDPEGVLIATVDGRSATVGHAGEEFPDYESILMGLPAGDRVALAHDAVRRALAELPADAPHLRLDFESEQLVLRARDRTATAAGSWSGAALRVFVDARFFSEAIEATVGPDLVIEASDPLHPITLRSADTGTFSVLTMPIRPTEDG